MAGFYVRETTQTPLNRPHTQKEKKTPLPNIKTLANIVGCKLKYNT